MWVAVLGVADAPGTLSEGREAIVRELGDALRGRRGDLAGRLFEGLPPDETGDSYVLAIQQSSRAEVRVLASQTSKEPRFVGPVHLICTD